LSHEERLKFSRKQDNGFMIITRPTLWQPWDRFWWLSNFGFFWH